MAITYVEKSTLGRGNYVEVKRPFKSPRDGRIVPIVIGWIGELRSGAYA